MVGELDVGADQQSETWLYNDQYPGPEIRVAEGDQLQIEVENELPEGTTVHWHGIPLPNEMDGVPGVTQEPIEPGETFTYSYPAGPAGTYIYHSHVGLQLDRALSGPLIVEEETPHVDYDREYTFLLDDYLPEEPRLEFGQGREGPGPDGSGPRDGRGPGRGPRNGDQGDPPHGPGMMQGRRPPYAGLLLNGRLPTDPDVLSVEEGERVRLRFINPSSATTYRVGIGGHELTVTHADGRPVEPVTVDSFPISMGERYDVLIEAENPGTWAIQAIPIEGDESPAEAIVQYEGVTESDSIDRPQSSGRELSYRDLRAVSPIDGIDGRPEQTFDLTLTDGMGRPGRWTINGQVYPDADPLHIREGDHVRVRLLNRSTMIHPMHLHGHFFQVGSAVKDTVMVPPRMGRVQLDFLADNPGDWLFHCHHTYHMELGMARVFEYTQ
ncbi:multicopper oxidase family protein [Natronorarus salvus]|uniref:multicopper oxidase family protein n=1 Tax=Natronorarus salvus TaxID=3117733 RepID=UPI002F26474A